MFLKKKREGRKEGKNKRKIKSSTTDSKWPYMKTSSKQSDLALSLFGMIVITMIH